MVKLEEKYAQLDPVWDRLRSEAQNSVVAEPAIGGFVHTSILQHASFENALAHRVASKLASNDVVTIVGSFVVLPSVSSPSSLISVTLLV